MTQIVFPFGTASDNKEVAGVDVIGGKGHHLARMAVNGVLVPPGFTISTEVSHGNGWNLTELIQQGFELLDGVAFHGILYSVRSGAPVSMPGMMDTVLNVGIFRHNIEEFEKILGKRTAWDCYRRFLHMYGKVVLGLTGFNPGVDTLDIVFDKRYFML